MLKYIGKGFIPGIPARDLNEDEVKKYGGIKYLLATGLFAKPEKKIEIEIKEEIEEGEKWQEVEPYESYK